MVYGFIRDILHRSVYWHFNSVLAADINFKDTLSYFWSGFRESTSEFSCLSQWWDRGKAQIKQLCQQHTLNVTRDITRSISDLETDVVELNSLNS